MGCVAINILFHCQNNKLINWLKISIPLIWQRKLPIYATKPVLVPDVVRWGFWLLARILSNGGPKP
jgi:hypothetical protein